MTKKTAEILFEVKGSAGVVTLNRPEALNAVTLTMVRALSAKLRKWRKSKKVRHVVVRAVGERAFSAGGDIRNLYDWGKAGKAIWRDFYREEYRLNSLIKHFEKPYISLIGGIVMGGGVGISINGSHRVGTEKMSFAMPEVGIGFFPDVGGTWFLPRLPGEIGTYLALTGERIGLEDARYCGLANHAVAHDRLGDLVEALSASDDAGAVIADFEVWPNLAPIARRQAAIDRLFAAASIEEILANLDAETGAEAEWAAKTAATIRKKSPLSLKVTLRQLRFGRQCPVFDDCMRIEYRIVDKMMREPDFFEGVRAVIIDKDNAPRWQPATIGEVDETMVGSHFTPPEDGDLAFEA